MRVQQVLAKFGVRKIGFTLSQGTYQVSHISPLDSTESEVRRVFRRTYTLPPAGSGAGKGGGAGGSVRESGGSLGQYGAAHEEEYFYNKHREQLQHLKSKMKKSEIKPPEVQRKEDDK